MRFEQVFVEVMIERGRCAVRVRVLSPELEGRLFVVQDYDVVEKKMNGLL
jgi:hypothetical protein